MHPLIEANRDALSRLCIRYRVQRLELFGSAVGSDFDPETSDLDFLVQFQPLSPSEHYEAYFGLLEALRERFQRDIDLVEAKAMRNPYFIRRVNESRKPIHADRNPLSEIEKAP